MKKIAILILLVIGFLAAPSTYAREKALGVSAGFHHHSHSNSPDAGLWFQYAFSQHVSISPSVDYYFRHNGTDAVAINTNMQFPFALAAANRVAVYPLAGVNFTSWNNPTTEGSDSSSRNNRFGLNLGGGIEYRISSTAKIGIDAKATLIRSYSSATINFCIGYCF